MKKNILVHMDKISVVMSTYNERMEYLSLAIESIISQTHKNIEFIILLDNPQNADIKALVGKYAKMDNRICVIENEHNIGLTASLNKGFNYATGDYYARMDADDVSDKNRLECELTYMKTYGLDLVGCMTRRIDSSGNVINELTNISKSSAYLAKKLRFDNCIAHPTWLLRKELYDTLKGYRDIKTAEDYDFLLRAIYRGYRVGICDKCLFSYRSNITGISRSNSLRQFLTSWVLQRNFHQIDKVDQYRIDKLLQCKITKERNEQFEKGVQLMDKAIEQIKDYNMFALANFVKALFCSKYIGLRLYNLIRIHTLV